MFRQLVYVHWKAVRWILLPLCLAAFTLPLLSVQGLGALPPGTERIWLRTSWLLDSHVVFGPIFPALAVVAGSMLAVTAWGWDHQSGHVYALSLPISRWRYVLLKMGAGALLLGGVVALFALGALLAAASATLPPGFQAYPGALALRFLLATVVVYAFVFALAAATVRTVTILVSVLAVLLVAAILLNDALTGTVPGIQDYTLLERLLSASVTRVGPFRVLAGNWMLIGV